MARPRGTLAFRIAVLSVAIAVGTALIAGSIAVGLIRHSGASSARSELSRLAAVAQSRVDARPDGPPLVKRLLQVLSIQYADVSPTGAIVGPALARAAIRPADIRQLLAGRALSALRVINGKSIYLEGRPTSAGAIVLVERRSDATALGDQAIRRIVLALLVAAGVAAAVGLLVAWRLARPLRRTAQAAHALAAGRRDVTVTPTGPAEVAEVAEAINALSGALSQSEGRQREFLMSVSHDLRTPLTAITGYAESLAEGVVSPDQVAAVGGVLRAEASRLNRLVTDLLDLARLDAQDFRIDLGRVEVGEVVRAAAQVWSARCAAARVHFAVEAAPVALVTVTDAARLRQILDGLLENALRVTPEGAGIVLAARPDLASDGRPLVVAEVRDSGPGLTHDDLAVAFDRGALYRRYRGVRQVGTGLGLAIVHRLVVRLGGQIEAGRAPEGGARFTVRLPAAPPSG